MNKYHSSKLFQISAIIIISGLCLILDTLTQIHYNKVTLPKNKPEYKASGVDGSVYDIGSKSATGFVYYSNSAGTHTVNWLAIHD